MTGAEATFAKQEKPWPDWQVLEESTVITKLEDVVAEALANGAKEAARITIIGVGNYAYQAEDWPKLIACANELLDDIEGKKQSKRWG